MSTSKAIYSTTKGVDIKIVPAGMETPPLAVSYFI